MPYNYLDGSMLKIGSYLAYCISFSILFSQATFTEVTEGEIVEENLNYNSATWCDYDNDGYLDLIVGFYVGIYLYHNNTDGTFEKIENTLKIINWITP